jgi:hypothetical protein
VTRRGAVNSLIQQTLAAPLTVMSSPLSMADWSAPPTHRIRGHRVSDSRFGRKGAVPDSQTCRIPESVAH